MLIDIYHDTVCPWCLIGKKHLFDALKQLQDKPKIHIQWHPFLLDDTIPDGGYDFRGFMQASKGLSPEQIQEMFDYTRQKGEEAGVQLNFDNISLAVNSTLSHVLISIAPEHLKNAVADAIYQAYFKDGLNIGSVEVLIAISEHLGMDSNIVIQQFKNDRARAQIKAESEKVKRQGLSSVPFFVINNTTAVNGSQSVEAFLKVFKVIL